MFPRSIFSGQSKLLYIYIATVFVSFHVFLVSFINSSFLEQQKLSYGQISLVFAAGSFVNLIIFLMFNGLARRYDGRKLVSYFATISMVCLLALVMSNSLVLILIAFILHRAITPAITLGVDSLLEANSTDDTTGETRGLYLTIINLVVVFSPTLAGIIVANFNYYSVYLISAIMVLPLLWIIRSKFHHLKDYSIPKVDFWHSFKELWREKDLRKIYIVNLLLQLFFTWATLYIPLYLLSLGFDWRELGLLFGIAVLPFVILPFPVGVLADRWWGEKELLVTGFVVLIVSLVAISLGGGTNFFFWVGVMFATRIGAALIETMSDSYFFKKIGPSNNNLISAYRTTWPLGHVLGALFGAALLLFLSPRWIYSALAILLLLGVMVSWRIEDTK